MRLCQILYDGQPRLARKHGEQLEVLRSVGSMLEAIAQPELMKTCAVEASLPERDAQFLPVVSNPGKIVCIGTNYKEHIKECGEKLPTEPLLFSKFRTALSAHNGLVTPPECAHEIDYEAELVLIVGKRCRNVTREEALSCLFGCACGNDLSARDLQFISSQWMLGKTPDGFAPVGPYAVTLDEIGDLQNLNIESRLNGELRQHSNTRYMIFDCAEIIRYLSGFITLEPGDLIFTGTPDGVILGYPEAERRWMTRGDRVDVTIESIGTLTTYIG